jgi:6-methylsalicylate decarboxylase
MRIDVHAHYWTEDYLELLVDLGKGDARAAGGLGAGDGAERRAAFGRPGPVQVTPIRPMG